MNAPGKGLLMVVGILFIIFGGLSVIVVTVAIVALGTGDAPLDSELIILSILALVVSVLELVAGILSVRNAGKPENAMRLIVPGIIIAVLTVIPIFGGDTSIGNVIGGLLLPVLLIVGASLNKKAWEESDLS